MEQHAINLRSRVKRGNDFDRWDLQVENGMFGKAKCLLTIEEYGNGRQYLKLKCWKEFSLLVVLFTCTLLCILIFAALYQEWTVMAVTFVLESGFVAQVLKESTCAMNSLYCSFEMLEAHSPPSKLKLLQPLQQENKDENEFVEKMEVS